MTLTAVTVVGVLAWQINRLGSQDHAEPADAIVILGARVDPDGTASSDLMSRTYHAMDLYQAGMAPVVICAGGVGGDRLAAGAVACRFAQQELGLPADRALVAQEADAWTTADEAAVVADLMQAHGLALGHPGQPSAPSLPGAVAVRSPGHRGGHQPDEYRSGQNLPPCACLVHAARGRRCDLDCYGRLATCG